MRMHSLECSEVSRCRLRRKIEGLSTDDRAVVESVPGPFGVLDADLLPPLPA